LEAINPQYPNPQKDLKNIVIPDWIQAINPH
jgi:hypothetical protein